MTKPKTRAIATYQAPGERQRPRALTLETYRLTLSRESDGQILHEWGGIPADKVRPLLQTMRQYLPILAKAAAFKEAWAKLMDLFS